jgi:hypothetical protein
MQTKAPGAVYGSIACSADGTAVIAAYKAGTVYLSTNDGENWAPAPLPSEDWLSVASSADGSTLFAGAHDNLFISTNSGLSWTTNIISDNFGLSIACSADGKRVTVATGGGKEVLYSTNSGGAFTSNSVPGEGFNSVASSADGMVLVATYPSHVTVSEGGQFPIYRSIDGGTTWTPTTAPSIDWWGLACSSDGTTIAAVSGALYLSKDSGNTWTTNTGLGVWTIACSADGTRLVAAQMDGVIFTSLDSGQTWATNNVPVEGWTGTAISADGSFMAACSTGVYTVQIPAQPSLKITTAGSNLLLSWPLPSAGFVLEENSTFNSSGWVNVTNAVTQCGYYNQVTVSPPVTGNVYYRLVNQ